jgi:hypothetical protein
MPTDDKLEQEVKLIIMELMMVLHKHGINEVHMGGLMRVIGVDEATAQESDQDRIVLDEKFTKDMIDTLNLAETPKSTTQTLH